MYAAWSRVNSARITGARLSEGRYRVRFCAVAPAVTWAQASRMATGTSFESGQVNPHQIGKIDGLEGLRHHADAAFACHAPTWKAVMDDPSPRRSQRHGECIVVSSPAELGGPARQPRPVRGRTCRTTRLSMPSIDGPKPVGAGWAGRLDLGEAFGKLMTQSGTCGADVLFAAVPKDRLVPDLLRCAALCFTARAMRVGVRGVRRAPGTAVVRAQAVRRGQGRAVSPEPMAGLRPATSKSADAPSGLPGLDSRVQFRPDAAVTADAARSVERRLAADPELLA
jgi:hypothetical protein